MKKLILILVIVFPFLANGQDYRVVDWKTDVLNVQTVGIDTFKFDAEPKDYNDAGAITREIGNYFIDYVARCFKIIGSDATTITVVDLEHINSAPQSNQIGRVYQSVVDADSLFESIGGVDISVLDQMSIYRDVARNNEIICRLLKELAAKDTTGIYHANRQLLDDITPEDTTRWATGGLVTESDPTVSALVKSIDANDTSYWGRAETDPTVSAWAKAATKPTYTYSEVGAQPAGSYLTSEVDGSTTNEIQDLSRAGNTLSLSSDGTTVDLSDLVNPDLTGYRLKTDHDSLSNLDEKSYNSLTDKPASLPASDVYPWAKAATKPTYTYSEVGAQPAGSYLTSEVDGSTTNEIQDLSRAGNTLSLSGDGTSVDLSDLAAPDLSGYATTTQLANQLSQTISNGITTKAPSEDAVYDALTGKATISGTDNYLSKTTGPGTLGNSTVVDNGSTVSTALPFSSSHSLSAPTHFAGTSYWNPNFFELGYGQTGNRYAGIDLTGDDTYSDYGLRIIRGNTGANATSSIFHRGKGDLSILAQDAGRVILGTKNTNALIIDTLQNVGIGTTNPTHKLSLIGNLLLKGNIGNANFVLKSQNEVSFWALAAIQEANKFTFYDANNATIPFTIEGGAPTYSFYINSTGNVGIGMATPSARIHSQSTGTQLRLGYDATKYTDLSTNSAGTFNISPSSGFTIFSGGISASAFSDFTGQVEMTGDDVNFGASTVLRKNGYDIFTAPITMGACGSAGQVLSSTGPNSAPTWTTPATGSGSGITSIGMQVPTGLTVSPSALTSNGTFTIGLQSGYSIPTTANQTNWSTAYTNRITSAVGTTPLALSISNNTLSGYLSWTLTNINNATPAVGYLYYNGSTYSYQAATTTYTLPTASSSTLGGVKINGNGMAINAGGVLFQEDNNLTTRTPEATDYIAFYDNSATAQGKMTLSTLGALIGGASKWTADAYGISYLSGNVGIGRTSSASEKLSIEGIVLSDRFVALPDDASTAFSGRTTSGIAGFFQDTSNGIGLWASSSTSHGVLGQSTSSNGVLGESVSGIGVKGSSNSGYGGQFSGLGVNISSGNLDVNSQTRIKSGGFFQPGSSTDAAAPNNSIYYSTTQSKLVYKDPSGSVHPLY